MAFERPWNEFTCARFVTYPKGDFAYTVVRQFFFDVAEEVRLRSFLASSSEVLRSSAAKILKEEAYHRLHTQGLVERLGDATEESRRRMQAGVTAAYAQALGLFEALPDEAVLVAGGVMTPNIELARSWIEAVAPVLRSVSLTPPVALTADAGGRRKKHLPDLEQLVTDLQSVYRLVPGGAW